MGFNHDPWNNFNIQVAGDFVKWGECESCGGAGQEIRHTGEVGDVSPMVFKQLLGEWHDHLKKSHKIYPPCGFFVTIAGSRFYCTLMENHTSVDYDDPRTVGRSSFDQLYTGPVPHAFTFEVNLEDERHMGEKLPWN